MERSAYFREKAAHCRRMAACIYNTEFEAKLLTCAAEYDAKAVDAEEAQSDRSEEEEEAKAARGLATFLR